jgi:hypothetical protein
MTDMALADRVYFVASSAYLVENSHTALTLYNNHKEIGTMVMEILTTKQKMLRAKS